MKHSLNRVVVTGTLTADPEMLKKKCLWFPLLVGDVVLNIFVWGERRISHLDALVEDFAVAIDGQVIPSGIKAESIQFLTERNA